MKSLILAVASTFAAVFTSGAFAAEPAPMPTHESFTINSEVLSETRHINVYTPPGYGTGKRERYPVLYMPDGGLAEDFPHVATDIDVAIRASQVRPMIVVGIENTERRRDMTGPTEVASDRKIAVHVGGSGAFRAFIADELMPDVRHRYRTNGKTEIVGESLAGLFVVETFFLQPRMFDTYIALSPSLWWNSQTLIRGATARLATLPHDLKTTFYFATAGDDGLDDAGNALQAILRSNAPSTLTWFYEPQPDLKHSNIYVRASPAVVRKLFAKGM